MIIKTTDRRMALLVACSFAIGACGGDKQTVTFPDRGGEVFYTYPDAGQLGVSTRAPIVVRLSHPVENPELLDDSMIHLLQGDDPVPVTVSIADGSGGRSIVLNPVEPLAFGTEYRVEVTDLATSKGLLSMTNGGFSFTTALAAKGPKSQQISDDAFAVTRMFPDNAGLPIIDFSSLRFQFSQPINTALVDYGVSLSLQDDAGELVPAIVLAKGHYLTIDPVEDLIPGIEYTLTLSDQLESRYGVALDAPFNGDYSFSFAPLASGPTEVMVLQAPASGQPSPLTGQPVNLVPVIATLLGTETRSQQQGDVFSELAFVPNFPVATPMRIARGSMLSGDELVVRIGGQIPAGFNSGDVKVQFISDATGYLLPNPYSNAPTAPRQIRVFMDVAFGTGNAEANAAFNQDVLHLELIGQAIVENGVLVADALTVVESDVLGLETAFGNLSFRMEAYADQVNAPTALPDMDSPTLQSWMPGDDIAFEDNSSKMRPGDPIVLNFTKPLDPRSLKGQIDVLESGMAVADFRLSQDGLTLVINTSLEYGNSYDVVIADGIVDLAGNPLAAQTLSFTMPEYVRGPGIALASPFVMSAYPGFPCAKVDRNIAANSAGRCEGGRAADDRLPIPVMPADRSILAHFSQVMNADSIILGQTFLVEELDEAGAFVATVPGELLVRARDLRFTPEQPWKDGVLYRYVLMSSGSLVSSACNPMTMICSADSRPLRTRVLTQSGGTVPAIDGGGPNLEMLFRGAPLTSNVLSHLSGVPTADVNANALRDPGEDNAVDNPDLLANSARIIVSGVGGDVAAANVGCPVGETCLRDQYVYSNGALNGEVAGFLTAEQALAIATAPVPMEVQQNGGILVYLHPTHLVTSNIVVYSETSLPGVTADPADSGPLIMRIRYECDARANLAAPAAPESIPLRQCAPGEQGYGEGWIVEGEHGPRFIATLNGYLDAPALAPIARVTLDTPIGGVIGGLLGIIGGVVGEIIAVPLEHNQYSYGFSIGIEGPIQFYQDGRMVIRQESTQDIDVRVTFDALGVLGGFVDLRIPTGEINLNFVSDPIKR
ncbi:MAG: Ig-like domain-containing protein [Alcanivoracaceae bacterium]